MEGPWEKYQPAAPSAAVVTAAPAVAEQPAEDGPWSKYAATPAPVAATAPPVPAAPAVNPVAGFVAGLGRGAKDVIDTGAQLLSSGFDKVAGTHEGDRVAAMNTEGKDQFQKEYGDSTAAEVGRVGGQIAATLPVGGALGAGVRAAGAAGLAPRALVPLGEAIASGGMRAPAAAGPITRALGGAINGGVASGLANPDETGTGAAIGAAIPTVVRGLGAAGAATMRGIRGPEVPAGIREAAAAGAEAGYVTPPSSVQPSLLNRVLEGAAGKLSTAQNASARNQEVTNNLAKAALGVDASETLSTGLLKTIRARAGEAYGVVRGLGDLAPDVQYTKALQRLAETSKGASQSFPGLASDEIGALVKNLDVPAINSASAVDAISVLRDRADTAYRAGDKAIGKATKAAADALESLLERSLSSSGAPADTINAFRLARQRIAQTYSIERALNPTTGSVSAKDLAAQLKRGKPLTGELRQAAEFSAAFPKATQTVEAMGSLPQTSPLDWTAAAGLGAATGNPLSALGVLARPAARMAALSPAVQKAMLKAPQGVGAPRGLIRRSESEAARRLAQVAPVALTGFGQ